MANNKEDGGTGKEERTTPLARLDPEECNHAPATGKGLVPADKGLCGYCGIRIMAEYGMYVPYVKCNHYTSTDDLSSALMEAGDGTNS